MSQSSSIWTVSLIALSAAVLFTFLLIGPVSIAEAQGVAPGHAASSGQPDAAIHRADPRLDTADELAALQALQTALTEVADGGAYVWHRRHGRLNGVVRPTVSFRGARGAVCRHIEVSLTSGTYTRRIEGVACRDEAGVWNLSG